MNRKYTIWYNVTFPTPPIRERVSDLVLQDIALGVLDRGEDNLRSDEVLTLETSTFESLNGGQFTLSTQLIKPNNLCSSHFDIITMRVILDY